MHQPLRGGVRQPQRGLPHVVAGPVHRQRPVAFDQRVQGDPVDELQDQKVQVARLFGVEGLHQVRVRQAGRRPHLALEPFDHARRPR